MTATTKNHDYSYSGVPDKCLLCGDTKASHEPQEEGFKIMARLREGTEAFGDWTEYDAPEGSKVAEMLAAVDLRSVELKWKDGTTVQYKRDGAL